MKKLMKRLYFSFVYKAKFITKLLISYMVLILTPLLLLAAYSYKHTSDTLIRQFEYSSEQLLAQTSLYLGQKLSDIKTATQRIAFHSDISNLLLLNKNAAVLESYEDYSNMYNIIKPFYDNYDLIYSIEVFTTGKYASNKHSTKSGISIINMEDSYAREMNVLLKDIRNDILWLVPENNDNLSVGKKDNLLTGIRYMYSVPNPTVIGIVAVNIKQEDLNSVIKGASILPSGLVTVLDNQGRIMAVSDGELFEKYGLSAEVLLQNIETDHRTLVTDDKYFFCSCTLSGTNWNLVSIVPYDEMLKTSIANQRYLILITLAISFVFLLLAVFFSEIISKRILVLADVMKKVHLDNYSLLPTNDGTDEISELIGSYNYLLKKISVYADSQYQLASELKSQQLKALQAQINPHFLYNTLDLLNWIALDYDAYEISEIVSLLSQFYKLSLNKGIDVISARDAINHIEIYIKLQNFRFEQSIKLTLEIDPEIYNYKILNLLLQPIVENAVMHGIVKKKIPNGIITIYGKVTPGRLMHFEIIDNGIGMLPEQIRNITNPSESDAPYSYSPNGYGIRNVIERIKLFYGKEYCLVYESSPEKGTTVILEIPPL